MMARSKGVAVWVNTAYIAFVLLLIQTMSIAQQTATDITLQGDSISIDEVARRVESQSSYHFFYNPDDMDSMRVTIKRQNVPLSTLLDDIFRNRPFYYFIDSLDQVFITRKRELRTQLPDGFFSEGSVNDNFDVAVFDYMHDAEEKKRLTEEEVIHEIGPRAKKITQARAMLRGQIRNQYTGEPIAGAVIQNITSGQTIISDHLGFYSLHVPTGRNTLKITFIGMDPTRRELMVYSDGKMDVELKEHVISLREVVIRSERDANVSSTQMGIEKLDINTMRQVPVALGEADVMKVVLTLPGVQSVGESSTGVNVRGGATDQNLILFDDATIFNPSHLFGFFSSFNPDVVKSVELYKSGVPASYGGRLSSVMEVTSREGNKKKLAGSGGIGLVTGRLTLEGPLIKEKTSFLLGARSTYSDWLLSRIPDEAIKNSAGSFYDVNLHINHEANEKNNFDATAYFSNDRFRLNSDTLYRYRNVNTSLRWKHTFNDKLYGVVTSAFSQYNFSISSTKNPVNAFKLTSEITQVNLKADFSYFRKDDNAINFGGSVIRYDLTPGNLIPSGEESLIVPKLIQQEQGWESAVYIDKKFQFSPEFSLDAGLRYSFYQNVGPRQVFQYSGSIREESTIRDTISYGAGHVIKTYMGPEYRLSARYLLSKTSSIKFSAQRMRQYIHMLSNTAAISPTNIWKLSDSHIRPQVGDQISLGYYKNFNANTIETSVEVYYKRMDDFLDYKGGAVLLLNKHIETDVLNTKGKAYGLEILLKKLRGKLNGWVSYTYSRSLLKTDLDEFKVNDGAYYPSNFDKPHDLTIISNYRLSKRFSLSLNFTYSTGRPITLPVGKYTIEDSERLAYSDRNQFRIPDYYRADFSMNIEGNHKIRKLAHSSWSLSIYNLTGRDNVYSIFFKSENGSVNAYKMSIFSKPIPTITYNFRF